MLANGLATDHKQANSEEQQSSPVEPASRGQSVSRTSIGHDRTHELMHSSMACTKNALSSAVPELVLSKINGSIVEQRMDVVSGKRVLP